MDPCGQVYVSKNVKSFSIKCLLCEKDVEFNFNLNVNFNLINEWENFIYHIKSFHRSEDDWMEDPLLSNEIIKDEIFNKCDEIKVPMDDYNEWIAKTEQEASQSDREEMSPANDDCQLEKHMSSVNIDSQSEGKTDTESDSKFKKHSTTFNPSFHRRNPKTTTFVEFYKNCPCLWDPNDANYKNLSFRAESYLQIIKSMEKKFNISMSERTLKSAIKRLHKLYNKTLQIKNQSDTKIPALVLEHFKKCSFLIVSDEFPEDISKKESDCVKILDFENLNDVTLAFIDVYACFPTLYNPKHSDYNNIATRIQAYDDMLKKLNLTHNNIFNQDEIHKSTYSLRHWYYKAKDCQKKRKQSLSAAEQQYVQKCSLFLPPKRIKMLACEICDKTFLNESTLQVHLCKVHKIGDWPYKCAECERSFEHRTTWLLHTQRSHQDKAHQCKFCERRFSVVTDLKRHLNTHTGEKPFVCELCGKAFSRKTQLGYHSDAIHTKNRAYKCTMCPKDFLKKRDLQDHIKAHLNIRDKICQTCGKGFTNAHSLIRHRQIHSEVKKFACKLCDARFHQFVGLNAHMKRTHNIVKKQIKN